MRMNSMCKIIIVALTSCATAAFAGGGGNAIAPIAGAATAAALAAGAANGAVAGLLEDHCGEPWGQALCIMGVMAAAQAVVMATTASGGKDVTKQTTCTDPSCYSTSSSSSGGSSSGGGDPFTTTTAPDTTDNFTKHASSSGSSGTSGSGPAGGGPLAGETNLGGLAAQGLVNDYKKLGYTYDPATNTVTTPTGKINANSMNSAAGMAEAGFTPKQIAFAEHELPKVLDQVKATMASGGLEDSAGGTNEFEAPHGRGPASVGGGGFDMNKYLKQMMGAQGAGGAANKFAGMQKQIAAGEKIGVAGDNIFDMVTRKYKMKTVQGTFLLGP
jgi:hypothetical protein